jgi:hypothetical protein
MIGEMCIKPALMLLGKEMAQISTAASRKLRRPPAATAA